MKYFIVFYSLCIQVSILRAQLQTPFYTTFGGSGDDVAYSCKQTLDGKYIVAGLSSSSGFGQTDLYLIKVDVNGQLLWEKFIGGFGSDAAKSVIQLPDSGFVCCGYTNSFGAGGYDVYLIRTDKMGQVIWQKTFGGSDWDFGYNCVLAADGNLFIVGSTYSNSLGKKDAYALKCDLQGNLIWEKRYGGVENDELKSIYSKNGSEFYLCGSTCSFGEINGDMYCIKANTNGDTLFTFSYGLSGRDEANSMIVDASDSIILAGGITYTGQSMDAVYVKFNQSKSRLWTTHYGINTADETAFKIIASTSPVAASYVSIFTTQEVPGYGKDTKIIYMNTLGQYYGGLYSGNFGFPQDDEIFDISPTSDKGYISCGYTTSFGDGDKDVLIMKRDSVLFTGNSIVGLNEKIPDLQASTFIFPNPVSQEQGLVFLSKGFDPFSEFKAYATDLMGRVIELNTNIYQNSVDIQKLNRGYYLIHIRSDKSEKCFSLMIK